MQLKGKRVIVTGGGSGIGLETAKSLAKEGARVVVLDINEEAGKQAVVEAQELGPGPVIFSRCDISKQDEVNAVFDDAAALLDGLDVMLNIAGNEKNVPAEDVTESEINLIFDVHVKGTMYTNAAAFRHLKSDGGSIVNYTSLAGITGYPGNPIYGAAKGAVTSWTRNIAKDWGRYRIRANAVAPFVMTPMAQGSFDQVSPEELDKIKSWFKMMVPLGGWLGETRDAANANVFLASEASRFITGQILSVDGGFAMVR
ncbi:SDR family NAD(P)-dependent oxidoreductase (plasmid) [Nocardioides sp. R1-1]|uniref:SDR family NAD(P)-dependent oxidoreductase n=1 Tax=Nocardioides sp. R1-1 TaxID=3383502 RepID=UPI0038D0BC4F